MPGSSVRPPEHPALSQQVYAILLALADGEKHGYGIMKEIEEQSEGQISMGPGTLYGAIKRLLDEALIEESEERRDPTLDDKRRRYYRLTAQGLRVFQAETARLESLLRMAQRKQAQMGG